MCSEALQKFLDSDKAVSEALGIKRLRSPYEKLSDSSLILQLCSELRESEKQLYKLFHYSPLASCIVSASGYILDANPACLELWGYSKDELVNKIRWQDLTEVNDIELDQKQVDEMVRGEPIEKQSLFKTYLKKSGEKEFCYIEYVTVSGDDDKVLYFITRIVSEKFIKDFNEKFAEAKKVRMVGVLN